jgi:hypothetical protein
MAQQEWSLRRSLAKNHKKVEEMDKLVRFLARQVRDLWTLTEGARNES